MDTRCGLLHMRCPHLLALVMIMLLICVYLYTLLNVAISLQMLLIRKNNHVRNAKQLSKTIIRLYSCNERPELIYIAGGLPHGLVRLFPSLMSSRPVPSHQSAHTHARTFLSLLVKKNFIADSKSRGLFNFSGKTAF